MENKKDEAVNKAKDFVKEQAENLKNMDMKEVKKKWSWKGFFFNGFYYAGKGELKKGLILVSIIGLGGLLGILFSWLIAVGVWIYAGLKAREDLNLENKFNWKNVGIAVGVYFVIAMLVFMLNSMLSGDTTSNDIQSSSSSFFSSNNPPKYEGEDLKVYVKKVGNWLAKKWQHLDVKTVKKISFKSKKLEAEIKNKCKASLSKEELLKCFDDETEKVLKINEKYVNLSVDDYNFIFNPVDYYHLEKELTLRQVIAIDHGVTALFLQLSDLIFTKNGYTMPIEPYEVYEIIANELKISYPSVDSRAVSAFGEDYCKKHINNVAKFAYIIENSKYQDIIKFENGYEDYKKFVQACKKIGVEAK